MAIQIGVVKAITGSVTATAADGTIRNLQVGDHVYANELIATGPEGVVEIEFADGSRMDLGRNAQAMLDSDIFDPSAAALADTQGEDVPDDVAAIQQALLEGEDPTAVAEATAAGAGVEGGNEGHEAVFVDYLNPAVIPEAGFDTIGVANEYDLPEEDIIILEEEDGSPLTGGTSVFVDEDDLGSEFELAFVGPAGIISAFEIDTGLNALLPFVFGNNDEATGDDLPPDSPTTQTGVLNASFGSDGPGSVVFNPAGDQPSGLTSGGEPVLFWVSADGAMLVGYILTTSDENEFAEVIFTAELDPLTMEYAFTLHGPLDHADGSTEDNLLINLSYEVSDSDGDTADGILQVNVDDDSPLVELTLNSDQQSELPLSIVVDESVGTDGSTKDEPGFAANDDETDSADPDDIGFETISGAVLFNVDVNPGADGENIAARSFALTLALPEGESEVDSGLDATDGGDIMLSFDGDDIIGTDGDGHVVFRISIDADTGDVTVSQYEAIDHGEDGNDHDALLNMGEGLIGANVTVFDNDGDSATSEDVDLGGLIGFEDDGPAQTVTVNTEAAAALAAELDETEGDDIGNAAIPEVPDGNTDDAGPGLAQVTTAVTGGLAALFTASGSYGSDGAGMVTDSLSFIGVPGEGLATTLSATDGGAITLYLEGGELVGRDGDNDIVFTVAIIESPADSGEYQLQTTLFEAIDHGDDGNLFDSVTQLLLSGEGEVQLQYEVTRTDGDGDEVIASDQITLIDADNSVFSFDDDGPAQTVTADAEAAAALAVELDETEGDDIGNAAIPEVPDGNTDDAGPGLAQVTTAVTGGLAALFTASGSYGSDGAGMVTDSLSFIGVPGEGLATTLSATDGGAITLYLEGGELVGRDGDNDIVFTVAIIESPADSGEYQLQTTLFEAIDHGDDGNLFDSVTQLLLSGEGEVQLQYEVTRTDGDGDEVIASDQITLIDADNSVFSFDDDGPVADDDIGNVSEGGTLEVLAASGVLTNDDSGNDGYDGAVVGVVTGSDDSTDTVNGNVGNTINGLYGTLMLNADGSYTYVSTADAIDANAQDQFVYTIRDGDGDLTSAVLTVNVADVTVDPTETLGTVDEDGLAAGGNVPADGTDEPSDSETFNGNLTLQAGWTAQATAGSTLLGDYVVNADGTFSYTLTSVTDDGVGPETDTFSYTAEDGNGNTVINTVTITIIDDEPIAADDSGNVAEGATLEVLAADGVLDNDQSGADGYDGAVVGVVTGSDDSTDTINGNVGNTINGTYGTLTLNADGSYTYVSTADAIDANAQDQFVYTIRDGDGDLTSAVLTINVADITGTPVDTTAEVDEAGLSPLGTSAGDGSNQVVGGSLSFAGGFDNVVMQNGSTALGSWTVYADGTFDYTLNVATEDLVGDETDSFSYTATDDNGNSVMNTVTVTIIDDEPVFTIVNDGADIDDVVSLVTQNPTADMTYLGNFADWAYGADGFGDYSTTLPEGVELDGASTQNQIILNFYEGEVLVATLTLNADGEDSLEVFRREPEVEFIPVAATDAQAGGPEGSLIVDLEDAADFNIIVTGDDGDGIPNEADDLVNTSNQGWAVKGQQGQTVEQNESILFSFVDDGNNTTAFGIGDFKFRTEGYTGGITLATIAITITYIDSDTMMEAMETIQMNVTEGQTLQITELTWSDYEAGDLLTSVKITSNEPDGSFRLNGIEVGAESVTPPADLSYEGIVIDIEDGDGDTDSQTFSLAIDGDTGDGLVVEAITGTSGDDVLIGTAGDDFLIGGAGNDILTGDAGADTFEFSMAYNTGTADEVTDFEIGVDTLSFNDVIDDNNDLSIDFADVVASIDNEGAGGDLTINMTNGGAVTLTGLGTADTISTAAQLESYLGNININTDS